MMSTLHVTFADLRFIKNNWERIMIKKVIDAVNKIQLVEWMKEYDDGFFHLTARDPLVKIKNHLGECSFDTNYLKIALYSVQYIARNGLSEFKNTRMKNY